MISFRILQKNEINNILPLLFKILHANMSVIAPTGNSYEEDFNFWFHALAPSVKSGGQKIILMENHAEIIGYFQYSSSTDTFLMNEIQFKKEYQGTGLFRRLYSYLYEIIPPETRTIEAYAHHANQKSQSVLAHLGLQIIEESKNGNSLRFRGDCKNVLKKYNTRDKAIEEMTFQISGILSDCSPSMYLYGSLPLGDFRFGWSDIDALVLTEKPMSEQQAQKLLHLRQTMLEKDPGNPYFRLFEGGMLTVDAFLSKTPDRVVYWGTGGEKLSDTYEIDSFGMAEVMENGVLLCGNDLRSRFKAPDFSDFYADVERHYQIIRKYGQTPGRSLYSFGWLLDIARGLYTLRTGKIITKTAAGEWALEKDLCPTPDALTAALNVRRNPWVSVEEPETLDVAETLAEPIQRFADVLEQELKTAKREAREKNKEERRKSV